YPEALVIALRSKAAVAFSRRHAEEGGALNKHALELSLEHDLSQQAGTCYFILSDSEFRRDRYGAALEYLRDSLALARRLGSRPYEWGALAEMTYPLYMLGRWDEALAMIEEPTEEQTRSGGVLHSLLSSVLEIHLQRGRLGEAQRIFSLFSHLEGSADLQEQVCYLGAPAPTLRLRRGSFESGRLPSGSPSPCSSTASSVCRKAGRMMRCRCSTRRARSSSGSRRRLGWSGPRRPSANASPRP